MTQVTETTTTEEEEQEDASVSVTQQQTDETKRTDTTTRIERDRGPEYSLGISIQRSLQSNLTSPISKGEVEIEIGRKIVGDLWLTGAYRLDNTIRLGFRLEF